MLRGTPFVTSPLMIFSNWVQRLYDIMKIGGGFVFSATADKPGLPYAITVC